MASTTTTTSSSTASAPQQTQQIIAETFQKFVDLFEHLEKALPNELAAVFTQVETELKQQRAALLGAVDKDGKPVMKTRAMGMAMPTVWDKTSLIKILWQPFVGLILSYWVDNSSFMKQMLEYGDKMVAVLSTGEGLIPLEERQAVVSFFSSELDSLEKRLGDQVKDPNEKEKVMKQAQILKNLLQPFVTKASLDTEFCDLVLRYLCFFSNEFQAIEAPKP